MNIPTLASLEEHEPEPTTKEEAVQEVATQPKPEQRQKPQSKSFWPESIEETIKLVGRSYVQRVGRGTHSPACVKLSNSISDQGRWVSQTGFSFFDQPVEGHTGISNNFSDSFSACLDLQVTKGVGSLSFDGRQQFQELFTPVWCRGLC